MDRILPHHVAIIMDGNGRWGQTHGAERIAGHKKGCDVVQVIIQACIEKGIAYLTLFAFSRDNWQRPEREINYLLELFLDVLTQDLLKLHKNNIKLHVIGDITPFSPALQAAIHTVHTTTEHNTGLHLVLAINYSGHWDICQAVKTIAALTLKQSVLIADIQESLIEQHLASALIPAIDLLIRTSGELRLSNFMLWHLAYTELYFTQELWPDFDNHTFNTALDHYACRKRRYGKIPL